MTCTKGLVRFAAVTGCWLWTGLPSQAEGTDSATYLRPFVEFLRRESTDPQPFLLQALARPQVVILGEVHNRPRYWAFNASLLRAPAFAKRTGVVYMELPSNDQTLVERFLAASKYAPQPIIETLRDMTWLGWPDQGMLDFFKAVWETNQALPQATPEASLQSMLWATRTGNFDAFVACFPPDSKPAPTEFDEVKSQVEPVSAFGILSKETNSTSEVTLNVVLEMGSQQSRSGFIMKAMEGKWRFAGKVGE